MEVMGYVLAIFMGLVMGLLGSGGSLITVPVLVYLLSIEPVLATAYSLFIVGSVAVVGVIRKAKKGLVDFKMGIPFAIPAIVAVFLTRLYLLPAIPERIDLSRNVGFTKDSGLMLLFALLTITAACFMYFKRIETIDNKPKPRSNSPWIVSLEGLVIGVLTGLIGAGGGFLIIPVLVLFLGMSMKVAVGTSLLIISLKSLVGFLGDVGSGQNIDWTFLLIFSGLALTGLWLGDLLSNKIQAHRLRRIFVWFILAMGVFVLFKEICL